MQIILLTYEKGVPFIWDQACQNGLEDIKKYLTNPPVLCAPIKGKPLILYTVAMPTSLGALLAQTNDDGKEMSLYYLSHTLLGQSATILTKKKYVYP
jgi:hypothetical protein